MMIRASKHREGLVVPASEDFVAAFGCDVNYDEQSETQEYVFVDEMGDTSEMWIGTFDRTFGLSIFKSGVEVISVFDAYLSWIRIDEERQVITIALGDDGVSQELELAIWPRIKVSFSRKR